MMACKTCTCPKTNTKQAGNNSFAAFVIADAAVRGAFFILRGVAWGTGLTLRGRPSDVYVPCLSTEGAVRDFRNIVINYKKFSGPMCYSKLPAIIRHEHEKYVRELENLPEIKNVKNPFWRISPSSVYYPCESEAAALADYVIIVLDYWSYAGKDCFQPYLPPTVAQRHMKYVHDLCVKIPQLVPLVRALARKSVTIMPQPN